MQQELAREKAELVLPGMQRPYFMEYRLEDIRSYDAVANYGALTSEGENHQRVVRVEVRIGDYKTDSSSARGDGSLQLAPDDNDPAALKFALWSATDEAYKNALRAYATKQANLKHFQSAPTANDFTPAKPVTHLEPLRTLELDRADWKHRLIEASGLFATSPEAKSFADTVQYSSASVNGLAVNRYTVNTEGTVLRDGYSGYADAISVGGQAADGMQLGRSNGSTAITADKLESAESLHKRGQLQRTAQRAGGRCGGLSRACAVLGRCVGRRLQPSLCAEHRSRPPRHRHHRAHAGSVPVQLQEPGAAAVPLGRRRPDHDHV
jgi:TldD protein